MIKKITSVQNQLVQDVVRLKKATKGNLYIVEGFRSFDSIYQQKKGSIKYFFILESLLHNDYLYNDIKERCIIVSENVMEKISSMTTPPGILAVCEFEYAKGVPKNPAIVCYNISDPGNLGSLFRSAAAFSIKNIICIGGASPLNQKVIQASAGTIHLLNVYQMAENELFKQAKNTEIIALSLNGKPLESVEKNKNRFLVIGNEAHGLPQTILDHCSKTITIPMDSSVESLNAAVAGSIAMFYLF